MWAAVWRWLSLNGCSVLFLDCAEGTGGLRADASQRVDRSCLLEKEPVRLDGRGDGLRLRMQVVALMFKRVLVLLCERVLSSDSTNTMREGLDDWFCGSFFSYLLNLRV